MKYFTTVGIFFILTSVSVFGQESEDQKAIKSMCGCYEVKFNFVETFSYPQDSATYKPSKVKHETALEWVELVENRPDKISMQHLLIVGNELIIKHWRQDWQFENTNLYDFNGFSDWNFISKNPEEVKGQWTQSVFEVDDKPRYQGSASWVHVDGRHYWENTTNAPLPRREYSIRSDYNIIRRTNVHEVVRNGWTHDQDNDKIIRSLDGKEYLLAQEKGYNTYTRVEDSKCETAKKWWTENKEKWAKVRLKWDKEFMKNSYLKLRDEVDGKALYKYLFGLPITVTQVEIDQVIDRFIVSR